MEMELSKEQYVEICSKIASKGAMFGLELAPFKIKWYNDAIEDKKFSLQGNADALGFIVISNPSMFEKTFLPYIQQEVKEQKENDIKDPLDRCMRETFFHLSKPFQTDYNIVHIHDYEISPITKRPAVLVQTAGHVAGAVRLYQESDILRDTNFNTMKENLSSDKMYNTLESKVFPVCLHPKYGGWFALRGVLVFQNVLVSDLYMKQTNPPEILKSQDEIATLLRLYNNQWKDWKYRDVGMPKDIERYSALQKEYFETLPSERHHLITKILSTDLLQLHSKSCKNAQKLE